MIVEKAPTIVIADDGEALALLIREVLCAERLEVIVAQDGCESLEKLRERRPGLVTKPFSGHEFVARVWALLGRDKRLPRASSTIPVDDAVPVDPEHGEVRKDYRRVSLSPTECGLLT